jgi:hypothetical protein
MYVCICVYLKLLQWASTYSLITLLMCGGKETNIKQNPLLFLNCETHLNPMVLPSCSQIRWVSSWLWIFPTHNTTCTCMMTSDEIILIQMKGRKLFTFDKEQFYWIFLIIFQDPIVGNGQKSRMLSCEPVNMNANKWA